jgi:CRP-like cAMP-binding protein
MDVGFLRREFGRSEALRRRLSRYVQVRMSQLAQAAVCAHFHLLEARLARRLLMTQDRSRANSFNATQEILASKLGVRRVGVTKAASALQQRRLIHYSRGDITVLDRRGLMAAACGCYKSDRDSYNRLRSA